MYARLVNAVSATRPGSWLVRRVAARVDPWLYRHSNGRLTSTGRPTLPMLTLTTVGRRSGVPRSVQLAYHATGAEYVVVASAMGQARHPAWSHNLEAAGTAEIQLPGRRVVVSARHIDQEEAARLWPEVTRTIPQLRSYRRRTDRSFRMYALRPQARLEPGTRPDRRPDSRPDPRLSPPGPA